MVFAIPGIRNERSGYAVVLLFYGHIRKGIGIRCVPVFGYLKKSRTTGVYQEAVVDQFCPRASEQMVPHAVVFGSRKSGSQTIRITGHRQVMLAKSTRPANLRFDLYQPFEQK